MVICPICGVGSNLVPSYSEGKTTAVVQRMSYCGHIVNLCGQVLVIHGWPKPREGGIAPYMEG